MTGKSPRQSDPTTRLLPDTRQKPDPTPRAENRPVRRFPHRRTREGKLNRPLDDKDLSVLALLEVAAKAGHPCPSAASLGAHLGFSRSQAEVCVSKLITAGRVERRMVGHHTRQIRVANNWTAPSIGGWHPFRRAKGSAGEEAKTLLETAKTFLRRRGFQAFAASVLDRRLNPDVTVVGGRTLQPPGVFEMARRFGWQKENSKA